MTLEQYNQRLVELAQVASDKAYAAAVVVPGIKLLATIKNRIQRDGKNSQGQDIGKYSTKEMYATKNQFIRKTAFKAGGKQGGQAHVYDINTRTRRAVNITNQFRESKTMYLEEGYKELREVQGMVTDKVNYTYSGSTLLEYQHQYVDEAMLLGMVSEKSAKIREGLEKKRGKAFYATESEKQEYNKEVKEEADAITINILKGA